MNVFSSSGDAGGASDSELHGDVDVCGCVSLSAGAIVFVGNVAIAVDDGHGTGILWNSAH